MFKLTHKKVLITGGCSGIGPSLEPMPAEITFHEADITSIEAVLAIAKKLKSIDILVNNAGIPQIGNLEKTSPADFQNIFDVNVKGAYHCMYAFIPAMIEQKSGVILNMASVAASVGIPDRFGYSMTKGAIKSMTQSVAKDYISLGIRCNCISPGRVHTPFVDGFIAKNYPDQQKEMFQKLSATQPIGRMAKPQEIAHLALYLCSDEAAFITGCDYPIDGGFLYLNN
jgi:NAD(P)-dependent dehydrogenase (short-subunit alcohol dehydrogenase family)